jgi:[protein-PII] uridylyltransferase
MSQPTTQTAMMKAQRAHDDSFAQYCESRAAALTQFAANQRVQSLWRSLTKATDALLVQVANEAGITLLAVGGYGRGEMFPFSDVDVLVLVEKCTNANIDEAVERVLQQLWDMHIPISHATRTLEECIKAAQSDATITASLMDMRYLAGDRAAFLALKKRFRKEVLGHHPRGFVEAKLAERDHRHAKWGDSRLMLEPNIKDGKGGLRDLQTLTWLARYCYRLTKAAELVRDDLLSHAEWAHFREAYLFFASVRAHMHRLRGRADERLTFDLQLAIAQAMAFPGATPQEKAEKLMLRYFQFAREVGALTRIFCAVLEDENLRSVAAPLLQAPLNLDAAFTLDAGRLNFHATVDLSITPAMAVALFREAQLHGVDIHPRAQLLIARALPSIARQLPFEGKANALFLEILLSEAPDLALRRMSEMGVLAALIPEFGRITGMMQYDGYHTYTVDEHTLVAVGNLSMIESGAWEKDMPLTTVVAKEVTDRATLYLAMLCHDLAKGTGGGHAKKGEALVARIARRLGLNATQADMAGWLVKHHLALSETALKRDLDDPKTLEDFVEMVQSPERLRLLLMLTVADMKAVGPNIWNRWKGALMRDLYQRAMAWMGVGMGLPAPQKTIREALLADIAPTYHDAAQNFLAESLPASWWQRPHSEQKACIEAFAAWQVAPHTPALVMTHDTYRAVTEITCCMAYSPTLFRDLAGVMAWIGASIVTARSMVLMRGVTLATFGLQDIEGNSFAQDTKRVKPIAELITKACAGELDFASELPRRSITLRGRDVAVAPAVFIDNQVSATATVIEINARDRIGLLYDILDALAACQLQVMTAHIATYGQKAVDVFYVKDAYGIKIIHATKLEQIQRTLLTACGEGVVA